MLFILNLVPLLYNPFTNEYNAFDKPITVDRGHNDSSYNRKFTREQAGLITGDYPEGSKADLPKNELPQIKKPSSSKPIEPMQPQKKDDVPPGRFFSASKSDEKPEAPSSTANTSKKL